MPDDWEHQMKVLNKRKRILEIAETIDKVLKDWYSERGREVPKWKLNNNPDWWTNYLDDLNQNEQL